MAFVGCCGLAHAQPVNTVHHPNGAQSTPPSSADSTGDGWPDNPFAALGDGDLWVSVGGPRTVAALRWSSDTGSQTTDLDVPRSGLPAQRILVEAPGTLAQDGEIAVLLIGVAPDLESLLGDEAAGIAPHDGATLLSGGQYIEISVLISDDGGATFEELDPARLQDTPIRLQVGDLVNDVDDIPILYEHPTYIDSDTQSGLTPLAETGAWTLVSCITLPYDERAPEDTAYPAYLEAELRSLSVFAPLTGVISSETSQAENESEGEPTGGGTNETEIGEITLGETVTSGTPLTEGGEGLLDDPNGGGQMSILLGPGDPVWVDFGESGYEDGTQENPFNRFIEGLYVAALNGSDTVMIDRQTPIYRSGESGTYSLPNPVSIQAANGPVRIGEATATLVTYFTGIGAVVYEPLGESLSGLSYAINPEPRTFPEGSAITVKAYAAEGYKFDGWWFPEDQTQPASPEDLLLAGIHSFTLERNRLLWPVFTKNEDSLDTADPDADGLANFREAELGTNPNNSDSDGDGLPDWWEVNYDLDPLSAQGTSGASGNPDGDDWVNSAEFGFASSPVNPPSSNYRIEQGFKGVAVQFISPGVSPSVDGRVIETVTESLNTFYIQAPPPAPQDHYNLHTTYPTGDEVTWRFTPTEPYEDFVVLKWIMGNGSNNVLSTGNEVTFIADWWHYYPSTPPPPPGAFAQSQITLVLRGPIPSDAELKGINVTAPGPFGNAFFESEYTEWGTPDGTPETRDIEENNNPGRQQYPRASEVYFNAVWEATPNGYIPRPFEIQLEAQLNTTFSEENFNVVWSYHDDSVEAGRLINDGLNARIEFDESSPPVPGLYKIECQVLTNGEINAPPSRKAVAYILLPCAGPDIQDWLIAEARQIIDGPSGSPYPGVAEQWVLHVLETGEINTINIPFVGERIFDPFRRLERAFTSVSAFSFDYWGISYLTPALRPTMKYNYLKAEEKGEVDPDKADMYKFPAYATADNVVILRGRINVVLWAVWAKAVFQKAAIYGYPPSPPEDGLIRQGAWFNNLIKLKIEDPTAVNLGIDLYDAIMENRDDAWIKEYLITAGRVVGMQTTEPNVYDQELWPRPEFSAPQNSNIWLENFGLDDGVNFVRPIIFKPFANMDLLPWTSDIY